MDREEVVAAIGKPEHKVRERDSEGNDIEDWIYGQPPSKTFSSASWATASPASGNTHNNFFASSGPR